jgi:8-oxo-dGTP diphosphatase
VDVANVMGSRPDGWWRDRAGAAVRLHAELVNLAASGQAVPPPESGPPDRAGAPAEAGAPGFVMVLEGAAKAAAARISAADPQAVVSHSLRDSDVRSGAVTVVQARGSGDDAVVAVVRDLGGRRVVVTADRELRDRSMAAGATVVGPGWLLGLLRP